MKKIATYPLFLTTTLLSVATVIASISCFSPTACQNVLNISFSSPFLHLLFNSIIIVILAKEHWSCSNHELEKVHDMEGQAEWPAGEHEHCGFMYDLEGSADHGSDEDDSCDNSDDDDDDDYNYNGSDYDDDDDYNFHGSDGYDEDDDDDGDYGSVWWEDDDDECDLKLENRIETFITKIISGWREELLGEDMQD